MTGKHSFLGEELLVPNVNKVDCSRTNMFTNHLNQFLTLNHAERPRVFSNFENQVGKYSSAYKVLSNVKILKVFEINANNIYFIYQHLNSNTIDILHFTSSTNLTESYGFSNILIYKPTENEVIKEEKLIYRNNMYDDDLNMQMGLNLKTIFLAKEGKTFEDSILIAESAAAKLEHSEINEILVMLNTNDVLVNLMGDDKNYKPFPLVGEAVQNGILCARRRIDYNSILDDFKSSNFLKTTPNDQLFYSDGIVEDITIYSNFSDSDLKYEYNQPIINIMNEEYKIYFNMFKFLSEKKKKFTFEDDANYILQYCKDYVDPTLKFSYENTEFEGTIIKFTVTAKKPLCVGSKLAGRYGNKGVVSAIIPDDQMPMTEDGTQRADVCLNVLGVHSRMNPAQSYEHELNFFAQEIVTKYKDNEKELFKNIMKFYKIASPDQYSFLNEELKTTTDKNNFCKDIIANGVYIFQQPFSDNISVDSNLELHSTFKIPKKKFKNIYDPLVIADMYYIKLKHEAMGKLSIRSSGPISLLNVPYRNNDAYKKGNSLFSNSAIKLGKFCPSKTSFKAGNSF